MTGGTVEANSPQSDSSATRLVQAIMEKRPKLGALLRLTAVPLWFDADLLGALRNKGDDLEETILAHVNGFSFVHTRDSRYWYSPELRNLLLLEWVDDPEGFKEAHRRALAHFEARLADLSPASPAAYEEVIQACLFHRLVVEEDAGIRFLRQLVRKAEDEHRQAAAEQYVDVADEQRPFLSARAHAYLDYLHARLHQIAGDYAASEALLQELLVREKLPGDLIPCVQRALARSLVERGRQVDGIERYREALAAFQAEGELQEAAITMIGLANAHLSLALSVQGSGWLQLPPPRSHFRIFYDVGNLLARLPLVIYLMVQLGFRGMLPVAHGIGRHTDWIVARLLGTAARSLRRAETILIDEAQRNEPGSLEGLVRARENQAQLYRLLNHARGAEAINREILSMAGVELEGYRAARARLGAAHALLLREQTEEAKPLLEQVLPVFRRYGHEERVAETQTLLARAETLVGQPDQAVRQYQAALASWQAVGDPVSVTHAVHEMEALRDRPDLSTEAKEAIDEADQQISRRQYPIRYSHPALASFHRISLFLLVIVFFFALRLGMRTTSGAPVGPTAPLIQPVYRLTDPRSSSGTSESLPSVELTMRQQLRPELDTRFYGNAMLGVFLAYLAAYTVCGLGIIVLVPLRSIEQGRVQDVVVDAKGIGQLVLAGDPEQLRWEEVRNLLLSDRVLVGRPLTTLSFFALLGEETRFAVDALTYEYQGLQRQVRRKLGEGTPIYDLGFSLLHCKSGWIFLASLAYLLLFLILSEVAPDLLTTYLGPIPYNLSDLYGLAYLGVIFPLAWWFALQPLRARLLLSTTPSVVWWVGGAGLVLAVFYILQITRWSLPLSRPQVAAGLLSIVLIYAAAAHIFRARCLSPAGPQDYAYPPSLRGTVLAVAAVAIALVMVAILWELISFHHLAQGNYEWRSAEALVQEAKSGEAEQRHRHALRAFETSLAMRPEPVIENSRGAILARLGRYEEAIKVYEDVLGLTKDERTYKATLWLAPEPDELAVASNMASAFEQWAQETISITLRTEYYRRAIAVYDSIVNAIETPTGQYVWQLRLMPRRYAWNLRMARLRRGVAHYNLGLEYDAPGPTRNRAEALQRFETALIDFQWVVDQYPQEAQAYTGSGWAEVQLRERDGKEAEAKRLRLGRAIEDFEKAIDRSDGEISAFTGLGWAHYYFGLTYPLCKSGTDDVADAAMFRENIESAIQAYNRVVMQDPEVAGHYRVRAQLHYLLRYCDPAYTLVEQLEAARHDYDRALEEDPERGEWYYRRAHLYYALAQQYRSEDETQYREAYLKGLDDFEASVKLEPGNVEWWIKLSKVAYEWKDYARALEAAEEAAALEPDNVEAHMQVGWAAYRNGDDVRAAEAFERATDLNPSEGTAFWRLGWAKYLLGDYAGSVEASARAIELKPKEPAVYFNQGLAYLALGELRAAMRSYLQGIEAAEQLKQSNRRAKYNIGIADLRGAQADPQGMVDSFLRLLTAARAGELSDFVCQVSHADGALMFSEPRLTDLTPIVALEGGTVLWPLGRSPCGQWLDVEVTSTGKQGWVTADPRFIVCRIDMDDLPVQEVPSHMLGTTPTP